MSVWRGESGEVFGVVHTHPHTRDHLRTGVWRALGVEGRWDPLRRIILLDSSSSNWQIFTVSLRRSRLQVTNPELVKYVAGFSIRRCSGGVGPWGSCNMKTWETLRLIRSSVESGLRRATRMRAADTTAARILRCKSMWPARLVAGVGCSPALQYMRTVTVVARL